MPQVLLAQEATGSSSLIFLVVMVAVFWLFIIRPQRTRSKKQQELVASLQVGDQVQTVGGLKGRVTSIEGDDVIIELEQGRVRVTRRAIASRAGEGDSSDSGL
ncbi:preprotein translocase subunit YajC [soil metagenome]